MAKAHRICSLPECDKALFQRGMCAAHYRRWWKYGDPTVGGPIQIKARRGAPMDFLVSAVTYEGLDCLLWPFAKDTDGYGVIKIEGVLRNAHREVCRLAHGEAPSEKHEAAHDNFGRPCDSTSCVNPHHLRWASRYENEADKRRHANAA